MNLSELNKVATAMVAQGRGILAADESTGTIKKRFDAIGVESTADNRRDYREMLFRSTEGMSKHISGVILYDETIRQNAKDGTPLVKLIANAGSLPGIKVDRGTKPLPFCPDEVITEGLDGLRERLMLEGAEWAVPDQGLAARQNRDDMLDSARPDIEDHLVGTDLIDRDDARGSVGGKLRRHHGIDGKHDFAAKRFGSAYDLARRADQFAFVQRFADRFALGDQKRVGHGAADNQRLDLGEQIAKKVELSGNFGPADNGGHRMVRPFKGALKGIELRFHGAARISGKLRFGHDARGAGVLAMRRRKGIIDENVAERCQLLGEVPEFTMNGVETFTAGKLQTLLQALKKFFNFFFIPFFNHVELDLKVIKAVGET